MQLDEQLQQDIKASMKARDRLRTEVLRGARAALQRAQQDADKQRYDATRKALIAQGLSDKDTDTDAEGLTPLQRALAERQVEDHPIGEAEQRAVIEREVKRRHEAAGLYRQGGQAERAEQEEAEAHILETYLPRKLSADELRPQVAAILAELGLNGPGDMGKAMPALIERFQGQADNRTLSQLARAVLSGS